MCFKNAHSKVGEYRRYLGNRSERLRSARRSRLPAVSFRSSGLRLTRPELGAERGECDVTPAIPAAVGVEVTGI